MKRAISFAVALVMIFAFACPAFAAENEFVGSITYKDGPELISAEMDGEDVTPCVVITSIEQAENQSTDITQEERELLLEVYEKLKDGTMDPGLEDGFVIRELVDISFEYIDCRQDPDHGDKPAQLDAPGSTITIVLDLDIGSRDEIVVKVYKDGEWHDVEVTNNGDGTVTCVFDFICPVLFAVKGGGSDLPPQTGDTIGQNLPLWIGLMVVAAAGLVTVIVLASRKKA